MAKRPVNLPPGFELESSVPEGFELEQPKWAESPIVGDKRKQPITPEQARAELRRREALAELQRRQPRPNPLVRHALDVGRAAREIPQNIELGFLGAGEALLRTVQRRGMEKPVSDELIRSVGFEPSGRPFERPAISAWAERAADNVTAAKKRVLRKQEPVTLGEAPVTRLARPVVQNLPQYGAMVAASVLSGTPLAGLAVGAEMAAGSTFQSQMEAHGDPKIANIVADISGLAEVAGEALVFPKFIKGLSKGLPLRQALLLVAENAGQEGITGFAQQFTETMGEQIAKGVDTEKAAKVAFDEGIKAVPENAWVGAAMGAFPAAGGVMQARRAARAAAMTPPAMYTAGVDTSSAGMEIEPLRPWETVQEGPARAAEEVTPTVAESATVPPVAEAGKKQAWEMTEDEFSVQYGDAPDIRAAWRGHVRRAVQAGKSVPEANRNAVEQFDADRASKAAAPDVPDVSKAPQRWDTVPDTEVFDPRQSKDDGFYYHVTTKENTEAILSQGLVPGKRQSMDGGRLADKSRGKLFLTDRGGVEFWKMRIAEHLESQGRASDVIVLRVPKDAVGSLEIDTEGTQDAKANAYVIDKAISFDATPRSERADTPIRPTEQTSAQGEEIVAPQEVPKAAAQVDLPVAGPGEAVTPAKRRIRKVASTPVSSEQPTADGGAVPAVVKAEPRAQRGLEIKIHKLAKQAGLSVDQYHDALEVAVGKRSVKGLSGDELQIAADYFEETYGKAPAQTPVVVAGSMTTMEAVIGEAVQTATSLKSQKRVLRKRVRIGSAGGLRSALRAIGRLFFGDRSASPYFIAKVLDGGNESGVFGRVLDRNIQDGNSIRASLVAAITRMSRRARDAAGITPDDLARMSRAANPRPRTVERVLPKTEIIPVEIAGRTWDVTWGRLLDFYGQTSQVIPETGEPIGREYAKSYGIEIDKQITGPMTDAEIDYLRSLVEQNPKAKAELDIEWGVVGPFRAQAINAISSQTEGRAIAVVPNWWHIELGRGRRVPGKMIETAEPKGESETVEAVLKAEEARGFKIDLLENQDILKARRGGGRGPLVIRDWWERGNALNHAVAEYNGLALPFRTARTLLNHPDVQRELDAKGYEEPRKLLTELFSRIQGSERGTVGQMPGMFKKLRANFYRAVINWSPHVWLGQPTSVLNYGAYADAKYLPAASAHMFDPHGLQEILDNSPIAYERFHGGFSTMGLAESMESGAVVQALTGKSAWIDKPSIGMRVTDMMPLRGGWALAKAEFRDAKAGRMNPDGLSARWWGDKNIAEFEEGDQAWMNVIRERAEYLWQRSQQTWDPVNRSEITSNPNEAVRTLFMFRSYHDKVLTIWRDALLDLQTGRSTKAEFAGRVSYPMASYMAEAAARVILLTAIFGDVKEADDYITAIVTSPLQAFPIFGTAMQAAIVSFVRAARGRKQPQKYDLLSSPILDMVNKTAEAVPLAGQAAGEWAEGDTEKAQKTAERAMYRILEPLAIGLLGIPIYHARRLRRGYLAPEQEQEHRGRAVRRRVLRRRAGE